MIYNVYIFQNRKVEAFELPVLRMENENEYLEVVTRDYRASEDNVKVKMKEYVLYHAGTYDDNTGKFVIGDMNPILDLSTLGDKKDEQAVQ